VGHYARQFGHFGKPALIFFLLEFDTELFWQVRLFRGCRHRLSYWG